MIDLESHGALELRSLPVELQHVRDLEEYEGPLLSEFQTEAGESYLYYWCDFDNDRNRWLVIRTPKSELFRFLVRRAPLYRLVAECRDQFVYAVDIGPEQKTVGVWYVPVAALPHKYVPEEDSYYEGEHSLDDRFQDVYVTGALDVADVSLYTRRYLQAYAFLAAFGENGRPNEGAVDYRLTRGWVYHSAFKRVSKMVPSERRAKLAAVAMASPGYIRFQVFPEVAEEVRQALLSIRREAPRLDAMMRELRSWANEHKSMESAAARDHILAACRILRVDGQSLLSRSEEPRTAAKILQSFLNKVRFLSERDRDERALLVGLRGE